jgi:hypothetical protein
VPGSSVGGDPFRLAAILRGCGRRVRVPGDRANLPALPGPEAVDGFFKHRAASLGDDDR